MAMKRSDQQLHGEKCLRLGEYGETVWRQKLTVTAITGMQHTPNLKEMSMYIGYLISCKVRARNN